jgi:hypothetical protein
MSETWIEAALKNMAEDHKSRLAFYIAAELNDETVDVPCPWPGCDKTTDDLDAEDPKPGPRDPIEPGVDPGDENPV